MPDEKAKTALKNKIPVVIDYAATVMDRTLGVTLSHEDGHAVYSGNATCHDLSSRGRSRDRPNGSCRPIIIQGTKPSANAIAPFLSLQMWHASGTRLTRAERNKGVKFPAQALTGGTEHAMGLP
ncbi:hypothetical protein F442_20008 [Phytophthora nicotianae P10297]|uniref:Uncharacterized protein n=3 Tax=Phytophthora nicotianae TaxID=4792 RepID=V9E2D0_PHYNI|nr:hypothetical protein F443_20188 [Phytophthora nicotianae P1569]ETO61841.1 hypothetical protein F444_20202 [Phytophthora nicotianae P1976]ETP31068.1 hypothetical protein F442_20008 [Phytophthora nicotianae P10297]